ncbi:MAG TPA: ATP-binding protein [Rhodocyclaceae bacterium]|nr:ATP-binding protein [Rhodocyclaceae bacterium]
MSQPTSRVRLRQWAQLAAAALLCVLVSLAAYDIFHARALSHLREANGQRLDFYAASLESSLDKHEPLPHLAGLERDVLGALDHPADAAAIAAANRYLTIVQQQTKVAAIYLLDTQGLTLASSNWNTPQSFVGQRYTFRPYFREAIAGGIGRIYAVGATTREPGYFIAAPIRHGGRIAGVMVVKVSLDTFEQDMAKSGDHIALADSAGVVFLSAVPDWKYRTLGPLPAESALRLADARQYGDHPLVALVPGQRLDADGPAQIADFTAAPVKGRQLMLARPVGRLNWRMLSFIDLAEARQTALGQAAAVGFALAFALALAGFRRQRAQRHEERQAASEELRRVHADLERRIAERTEDLHVRLAELQKTEAILRETRDDAVQAGKLALLGQLAAGITHEINQPLAALTTFSDNSVKLLERGEVDEVRENLQWIAQLAQRLGRIVGQFKAFARKAPAELSAVDVADAVRLARVIVEPRRREMDAEIETDFPDQPLTVKADPVRLEQVLVNLMKNGLEAMDAQTDGRKGRQRLHLQASRAGDQVRLSIRDSGPGIAPEALPHLFEPFYSTKSASDGMGLGLALSRAIVESFGGSLTAHNPPEGGAEFVIILDAA